MSLLRLSDNSIEVSLCYHHRRRIALCCDNPKYNDQRYNYLNFSRSINQIYAINVYKKVFYHRSRRMPGVTISAYLKRYKMSLDEACEELRKSCYNAVDNFVNWLKSGMSPTISSGRKGSKAGY